MFHQLKDYLFPIRSSIDDIWDIIMSPINGVIDSFTGISIGNDLQRVTRLLDDCILRKEEQPYENIHLVFSAQSWPIIFRCVLRNGFVIGAIKEVGIITPKFKKVFSILQGKLSKSFLNTYEAIKLADQPYPNIIWEFSKHYYYLHVINDKPVFLNPIAPYSMYYNGEIDGTFIRKSRTKYELLPSIAIIISKDEESRKDIVDYLQKDLNKRINIIYNLLGRPID